LQDAAGRTLGEGQAGPSGLSQGVEQAWRHVQLAIAAAFAEAGLRAAVPAQISLGLGLAGAGVAAQYAAFMSANPGYAPCVLVNDGVTQLLGAHAGGPGLVVAAGTGSVAALRDAQGRTQQAGGWGFPVGDEGSGAWLGLHAMRHAQRVLDGRALASPLSRAMFEQAGPDAAALLAGCAGAGQAAGASLAPLVFVAAEAGDATASALLQQAADDLARLVHALDAGRPLLPIAMRGSVGERLVARWPEALRARVVQPAGDSCDGALRLLP
jgi:glucosamine kinase